MNGRMKRHSQQTGVTMIEVLVAILVSVIGLFSAMQLQLTAVTNTNSAYFRSQAVVISMGLIDQLRANPDEALAGNYDIDLAAAVPTEGGLETTDLQQWRADLNAALPSSDSSVACVSATRICSITVQWDDSRGVSGNDLQQFILILRLP